VACKLLKPSWGYILWATLQNVFQLLHYMFLSIIHENSALHVKFWYIWSLPVCLALCKSILVRFLSCSELTSLSPYYWYPCMCMWGCASQSLCCFQSFNRTPLLMYFSSLQQLPTWTVFVYEKLGSLPLPFSCVYVWRRLPAQHEGGTYYYLLPTSCQFQVSHAAAPAIKDLASG
jgi:hypothetical protein